MSRIDKINNLLDQIHAAVLNCKDAMRKGGEGEALSYSVHTLVLATRTLEELIEHIKPHVKDPAAISEIEQQREALNEKAVALIEQMRKLLTK